MSNQSVTSGATSSGIIVSGGDTFDILSAGVASSTFVDGGGLVTVHSGGIASDTTVSSGGLAELQGGASTLGFFTVLSGGAVEVESGYVDNGNPVNSGQTLIVGPGGTATNLTVS